MEGEEEIKVRENMRELKERAKAALMEEGAPYKATLTAVAHLMEKQGFK